MANSLDMLVHAVAEYKRATTGYPIYAWVCGVHYRIDSEDSEPVEVDENGASS